MDPDPDPVGPKRVDPMDPDPDPHPCINEFTHKLKLTRYLFNIFFKLTNFLEDLNLYPIYF